VGKSDGGLGLFFQQSQQLLPALPGLYLKLEMRRLSVCPIRKKGEGDGTQWDIGWGGGPPGSRPIWDVRIGGRCDTSGSVLLGTAYSGLSFSALHPLKQCNWAVWTAERRGFAWHRSHARWAWLGAWQTALATRLPCRCYYLSVACNIGV
jgi:hypothetical protein